MELIYTDKQMFGEEGPWVFLRSGSRNDFDLLSRELEVLMMENAKIELNDITFLKIKGTKKKIKWISKDTGNILCFENETEILSEMPIDFWEQAFIKSVLLSRGNQSSTYFFDNETNYVQNCKMAWEC